MSVVSNIIFSFSILEESREHDTIFINVEKINDWLEENHFGNFGQDVDKVAGGKKHLETPIFVAAFNYFRLDEFLDFVRSLEWNEPQYVQVFIQGQDDEKFSLLEPFE